MTDEEQNHLWEALLDEKRRTRKAEKRAAYWKWAAFAWFIFSLFIILELRGCPN
jgi:hypothetical protein